MAPKAKLHPFAPVDAMLASYATNNRINAFLIEGVADDTWRAEPPNGKGRTIAAIVAHMHNVRVMWLKSAAKTATMPEQLDRLTVTRAQALKALDESWKALDQVLRDALSGDGHIRGFKPDAASFLSYLVAHDAHHRGQITMLARQLGAPVSQKVMFGMWEWGTR